MIGYKGIELRNGILRSKYNDIFELNVPTEPMEVDDGIAFTEAGYSFCGRIEQVVSHENILPALKHPASRDIRLFEIESIGDVVGSSYHYKSTQIIVKREITQAELITYLDGNDNAQEYIFKNITKEQFSAYKSLNIDDYHIITSEKDIEKTYVKSCARLGQAHLCCQTDNGDLQLSLCDSCTGINWYLNLKTYEPDSNLPL